MMRQSNIAASLYGRPHLINTFVWRIIPDEMRHEPLAIRLLLQECHEVPSSSPLFNTLFLILDRPAHLTSATNEGDVSFSSNLIESLRESCDRRFWRTGRPPKFLDGRHPNNWWHAMVRH